MMNHDISYIQVLPSIVSLFILYHQLIVAEQVLVQQWEFWCLELYSSTFKPV